MLSHRQRALLGGNLLYAPVGAAGQGIRGVPTDAIPDNVVDNYEDDSADPKGPYGSGDDLSTYYNGNTGNFSRTTTDAPEASKRVEFSSTIREYIRSNPGDGLPEYPDEGHTVKWLINDPVSSGSSDFPAFASNVASDNSNAYLFELQAGNNSIVIYDATSGLGSSPSSLASSSPTLSAGTWYWCEADLGTSGDASLEYRVYDMTTGDPPTRDSQLTNGTVTTTPGNNYATDRGIGWTTRSSGGRGDWIRTFAP